MQVKVREECNHGMYFCHFCGNTGWIEKWIEVDQLPVATPYHQHPEQLILSPIGGAAVIGAARGK